MKKKLLLLSLCALLLAPGCSGNKVQLKDGKEVIASIKGKEITAEELFDELKSNYGTGNIVNQIDEYIANKEVKTTDAMTKNAKKQIAEMKEYYESMNQKWEDVLAQYGYRNEQALIDDSILNTKKEEVAKNFISKKVTEDEINTYYEKEIFGNYSVKHILISPSTTDEMSDDEKKKAEDKALKTAEEVVEKLKSGSKWADLVAEYSNDEASKENEGLISDFTKEDVVSEFFDATLELKDGEFTEKPVKSTYGYHIILRVKATEKPALDKVKDKVISSIVENKLTNDSNLYNSTWYDIRESYGFKINDTDIKNSYEEKAK